MKLQIQPWENEAGFILSVNTHDQVAGLDVGAADATDFSRATGGEPAASKEAIEQAWDDAGLPGFLRYLRDYIQRQSQDVANLHSHLAECRSPDRPTSPRSTGSPGRFRLAATPVPPMKTPSWLAACPTS